MTRYGKRHRLQQDRAPSGAPLSRRAFCAALGAAGAGFALHPAAFAGVGRGEPAVPDMIGFMGRYRTKYQDTLLDLARAHDLGFVEMIAANPGVDPWVPGDGTEIVLPTEHILPAGPREGLLLNLVDMRLYWFPQNGAIQSFAIGTGREAWNTPLGRTRVVRKTPNPTWYVPKSIRAQEPDLPAVVPPGPDNPLGAFAMYLGWPSYLIHGTNKPYGVGRRVSHGCVRMYPEGIAGLYPQVPIGTPVTVVAQAAKVGRRAGELMLEVHPSLAQADQIEQDDGKFTPERIPQIIDLVTNAAGADADAVDWDLVHRAVAERRGYPIPILKANRAASRDAGRRPVV
jgi:L,D-transpeptidase ErfK/SrfK